MKNHLVKFQEFVEQNYKRNLSEKSEGFLHTHVSTKNKKLNENQAPAPSFEELQQFEKEMYEKLKRATNWVLFKHPFYGKFMIHAGMYLTWSKKYSTACTDGMDIWFNVNFVNELTIPEIRGVIIHELLHIILLHCVKGGRNKGKSHDRWNRACDYALNWLIQEDEFYKKEIDLPKGGLLEQRFGGLSAEEIYEVLVEEDKNKPKPQKGDPQEGEGGEGEPAPWDDLGDPDDPDSFPDDSESIPIKEAMDEDGEEIPRGGKPGDKKDEKPEEGEDNEGEGEGKEKPGEEGKEKPGKPGEGDPSGDKKDKEQKEKPEEKPTVGGYVVGPDGSICKVTAVHPNGDVEVSKVSQYEQDNLLKGKHL